MLSTYLGDTTMNSTAIESSVQSILTDNDGISSHYNYFDDSYLAPRSPSMLHTLQPAADIPYDAYTHDSNDSQLMHYHFTMSPQYMTPFSLDHGLSLGDDAPVPMCPSDTINIKLEESHSGSSAASPIFPHGSPFAQNMCHSAGGGVTVSSQNSSTGNDSNGSCNSAGNIVPGQQLQQQQQLIQQDNSQLFQQHLLRQHIQQLQQNQQQQQQQQLILQNQCGAVNGAVDQYSDNRIVVSMGTQHSMLSLSSDTANMTDGMHADTFPDELFNPAMSIEQAEQKKSDVPPPPKKPLSPYMRFSKAKWQETKITNPSKSVCEIGASIGRQWRDTSDLEKQKYIEEFTIDKQIRTVRPPSLMENVNDKSDSRNQKQVSGVISDPYKRL